MSDETTPSIAALTHTLAGTFDVADVMFTIVRSAREGLGAHSSALVVNGHVGAGMAPDSTHVVAESVRDGRMVDPSLLAGGPAIASALGGGTAMLDDIEAAVDSRWPQYRRRALELGMRSVQAYAIGAPTMVLGALVVHDTAVWGRDRPPGRGQYLADLASIALTTGDTTSRRGTAMSSITRVVAQAGRIATAVGIVTALRGVDVDEARALLSSVARAHGDTVAARAELIVAAHDRAPGDPTLDGVLSAPDRPEAPRWFNA